MAGNQLAAGTQVIQMMPLRNYATFASN